MKAIPQPTPSLLIAGHLEFGDFLIMNGLIRVIARREPRVLVLTKTDHIRAARATVADLPNVEVHASLSYDEVRHRWMRAFPNQLRLGYFNDKGFDESKWDSEFYRQAGVPFEARWTECRFPPALLSAATTPPRAIALIHEKPELGFVVRRDMLTLAAQVIEPRPSILDWLPEVFSSKELHFVDSSFLNLAESLYAMGYLRHTTLCFHRYAKRYPGRSRWPVLRAPWRTFE